MWPQCGAGRSSPEVGPGAERGIPPGMTALRPSEKARKNCRFAPMHKAFFVCRKVDNEAGKSLYRASWARRRLARWRVYEAPHCSHGDRASGHEGVAMFAWPHRVRGFRSLRQGLLGRGRSRKVPGCLTSESEERETWTAGSLRAASSNGEASAFSCRETARKRLRRSTFQVNTVALGRAIARVFRVGPRQRRRESVAVRNVIGREKFSSNLRV